MGRLFRSFPRPLLLQLKLKGDISSAQEGRKANWGSEETSRDRFLDTGEEAPTAPWGKLR